MHPPHGPFPPPQESILSDNSSNVFMLNVWRGLWKRYGSFKRPPRFNPLHQAAVQYWLSSQVRVAVSEAAVGAADNYVVIAWRSETVAERELARCGSLLADSVSNVASVVQEAGQRGFVLTADIPAPANPCKQWHMYESGSDAAPRKAVGNLMRSGALKYDHSFPATDAGVLAIRDWLLATGARWFITCHRKEGGGDMVGGTALRRTNKCRSCFRDTSKYAAQIIATREKNGRASFTDVFGVSSKLLGISPDALGHANTSQSADDTFFAASPDGELFEHPDSIL